MTDSALECEELVKSYAGVPVLKGVSLTLAPGTVTALAGENGAGKSTLMKIAAGLVQPDRGQVRVRGTELRRADPRLARGLGVAIIPQELAPVRDMTVYENLFLGREIRTKARLLNRRKMINDARSMLEVFDVDVDPRTPMRRLSVAVSQIVEIVKGAGGGANVLLFDEPTSAIPEREVDRLYDIINRLRGQGVAMIYTTHKMAEIRAVADRVVVLRDGRLVLDKSLGDASDDSIVQAMIGRELGDLFPDQQPASTKPVLDVQNLHVAGSPAPVDLYVRRGEILGLAGLVGAGRTELLEGIFGARPTSSGQVRVDGRIVRRGVPAAAIKAGMAFIPEDRKGDGLVLSMSVLDNGCLPRLSSFTVAGWINQGRRRAEVGQAMTSVGLRSRGLNQTVGTLSGGNQQKVVLARWLTTGTVDVLLLDEPTRGVDVGARSEIYRLIVELAASGMGVVMASSDMPEVLGLSHRVAVLRGGALVGELDRAALVAADAQRVIFHLAAGFDADTGDARPDPTDDAGTATQRTDAGARVKTAHATEDRANPEKDGRQ